MTNDTGRMTMNGSLPCAFLLQQLQNSLFLPAPRYLIMFGCKMRIYVARWEVMDRAKINTLLKDLKHEDEAIRDRATSELWRIWFSQKGVYGLGLLERAQALLEAGRVSEAEAKLTETIDDLPDFAEAWNRRAVLYYMQKQYDRAILDCEKAIELNPVHFGALHGLGLCYARRGRYRDAIRAFQKALDIQPYASINQRLILECTAQLS